MTSPIPGVTYPFPRTWSQGDTVTVPRLRGDMYNELALSFGGANPLLKAGFTGTLPASHGTVNFTSAAINSWGVPVVGTAFTVSLYPVPFAGWYLAHGIVVYGNLSGNQAAYRFATGFTYTQQGTLTSNTDGGAVTGADQSNQYAGATATELAQLNPGTDDGIGLYGYQTTGSSQPASAYLFAEWVGLPTSGLTDYDGPYGTVVTDPQPAALWPPGDGTSLTAAIDAGAGTITTVTTTGMVEGGVIGLGYQGGYPALTTAETGTISTIAGGTITLTGGTAYPHSAGEPVAVPVSAALLNQQVRDAVNFLAYPPMFRAVPSTTQSVQSSAISSPQQIINLAATVDNFDGFSSVSCEYTVPVSGVYLVYGQVYWASSASVSSNYGCGVSVNGTVSWGTVTFGDANLPVSCPFHRLLRLEAGWTLGLYGFQDSGADMNTTDNVAVGGGVEQSRLLAVWRGF